jgi:uncharacterized membrane protein HdeD (DUF308 family)
VTVEVVDPVGDLKKSWWLLILLGLISIAVGGLLIFWPGQTLTVITSIFGFFMILSGVVRFFVAIFAGNFEGRWLLMIASIVGVVLGVVVLKNPTATIGVIVLITAIFWLISGMVDLFRGITNTSLPDRGARIAFGALAAILGVVVLVWPAPTVLVFAVLAGIYAVFFGFLEIVSAFALKKA